MPLTWAGAAEGRAVTRKGGPLATFDPPGPPRATDFMRVRRENPAAVGKLVDLGGGLMAREFVPDVEETLVVPRVPGELQWSHSAASSTCHWEGSSWASAS